MCQHNFEMPRTRMYFRIMSLYGLIVGSALENSESVSELVNVISSCRVFNVYVDSLHTRQFSMKLL